MPFRVARVPFSAALTYYLSGPLTTTKSESESVRRNPETKMPHNTEMLKVTWADILRGKSYDPRRGFGAKAGTPGSPQT